jgi:hypothetical protein
MSKDREVNHAKKQLERWTREPLIWVRDNFPTVKLSRQQEQFWVALGDVVNAKIMKSTEGMKRMEGILSSKFTGKNPMMWVLDSDSLDPKFGIYASHSAVALQIKSGENSQTVDSFRWEQLIDFDKMSKEKVTGLLNLSQMPKEIYSLLGVRQEKR